MQDQLTQEEAVARLSDEHIDRVVLGFMDEHPWPWHLDEVGRELGSQATAHDAIRRLTATGLMHRSGEFVFPTRTATRAAQIEIGSV
jgi:hypothetical protein